MQKDKDAERAYRWLHCALTQEKLQQPIVMCSLGRLYSKQNIIEQLLDKEKEWPESCKHIKSLRDIRQLNLTPNPAYKDEDKTEGLLDVRSAPYICKLIGLEMSGKFRFVALWSCGCVFSERALKEIGAKVCVLCQTPFSEEDVVILNGTEEDIVAMQAKADARAARRKAGKKSSKKKAAEATATTTSATATEDVEIKEEKPPTIEPSQPIVTTKVIKTELIKPERSSSKAGTSGAKAVKRTGASDMILDPEMKKLKDLSSTSVSTDPKASEVYKSLFTSHKTAQQQDRAHWVTYNPFYN